MKVFAVQTYEPKDVFMRRVEDGSFFDLQEVGLYTDRETAELMSRKYNELFHDEIPSQVVELEVNETSITVALQQVGIDKSFETNVPMEAA